MFSAAMSPPEPSLQRLVREMRTTAALAAPLVLGQVSAVAMSLIDTILAGHHGALTLAGVAVGGAIWTIVLMVLVGVLMAVPPSVAQCNGGGRRERIGPLFRQALWLALALGIGLLVVARDGQWLLTTMQVAPEVRPVAMDFIGAIAWGAPAFALYLVCRSLSEGLAWTWPTMAFGVLGIVLLLPLGYALMFGAFGLPALGAAGLGYASALTMWVQLLGIAIYLARAPRFADLRLFAQFEPPRGAPIRELLRIGLPMGFLVLMEGGLFVATLLLIGHMGAVPVAAHQIAINIASLCFMVPLGVGMATTVRVGHAAGAGSHSQLRWAALAGYAIVLITQTASALLMVCARHPIVALYTDDPAIAALAATLLLYAAAFQYPDGIQAHSAGALRGLKDTRAPMWITACAYWFLGMPLGWWLGVHRGGGAPGMWIGLIAGLVAAAALLAVRFVHLVRHDHRLMAAVARSASM
ncbi:MAG: MATE family efflux transporter [Proteobacteria bacterium]|nr:MATE family efflux transporter [Pseudomonadota bacterium]